jgi:hypothetical protein
MEDLALLDKNDFMQKNLMITFDCRRINKIMRKNSKHFKMEILRYDCLRTSK